MKKFKLDVKSSIANEEDKSLKLADMLRIIKENNLVSVKNNFTLY